MKLMSGIKAPQFSGVGGGSEDVSLSRKRRRGEDLDKNIVRPTPHNRGQQLDTFVREQTSASVGFLEPFGQQVQGPGQLTEDDQQRVLTWSELLGPVARSSEGQEPTLAFRESHPEDLNPFVVGGPINAQGGGPSGSGRPLPRIRFVYNPSGTGASGSRIAPLPQPALDMELLLKRTRVNAKRAIQAGNKALLEKHLGLGAPVLNPEDYNILQSDALAELHREPSSDRNAVFRSVLRASRGANAGNFDDILLQQAVWGRKDAVEAILTVAAEGTQMPVLSENGVLMALSLSLRHPETLKCLLKHPLAQNGLLNKEYTIFVPVSPSRLEEAQTTLLFDAMSKRLTEAAKLLLSHPGVDVNKPFPGTPYTPLLSAIKTSNDELTGALFNAAGLNLLLPQTASQWSDIASLAINGNKPALLHKLQERLPEGFDWLNVISRAHAYIGQGLSFPLTFAQYGILNPSDSHKEVAEFFLRHSQFDINHVNPQNGQTLLSSAAFLKKWESVKGILSNQKLDLASPASRPQGGEVLAILVEHQAPFSLIKQLLNHPQMTTAMISQFGVAGKNLWSSAMNNKRFDVAALLQDHPRFNINYRLPKQGDDQSSDWTAMTEAAWSLDVDTLHALVLNENARNEILCWAGSRIPQVALAKMIALQRAEQFGPDDPQHQAAHKISEVLTSFLPSNENQVVSECSQHAPFRLANQLLYPPLQPINLDNDDEEFLEQLLRGD